MVNSLTRGGQHERALLVVDVQNDFLPGGALAVPEGNRVLWPLAQELASGRYRVVVFTRDAHPPNHCSFKTQGGPWPVHCVADSRGYDIHEGLIEAAHQRMPDVVLFVSKGYKQDCEAYSAFDGTRLADDLHALGITHLVVGGLATDYCVKATVLDALELGFKVTVLQNAVAAVEPVVGSGRRALEAMRQAGAEFILTLPEGQPAPAGGL